MTRVNLIPVTDLQDQHLVAEYRELPMVPAALNRSLNSKAGLDKKRINPVYTLNTGHVYFFYDKGEFLHDRYCLLVHEMKRRGMKPDVRRVFPVSIFVENDLYGSYAPTPSEIQINKDRIDLRISQKPDWYRKTAHEFS